MSPSFKILAGTCLVVLAAACGSASGSGSLSNGQAAWPRVSHLRDGSSVSVWRSGRVVQRDRRGRLLADSNCGSYGRYLRWVGFMTSFRAAVLTGDRSAVATRIPYPLSWNHGRPWHTTAITDRSRLLGSYDAIFRPGVVGAVEAADPRALFCKDVSMVMLGSGVVWGDDSVTGRAGIVSVNGSR